MPIVTAVGWDGGGVRTLIVPWTTVTVTHIPRTDAVAAAIAVANIAVVADLPPSRTHRGIIVRVTTGIRGKRIQRCHRRHVFVIISSPVSIVIVIANVDVDVIEEAQMR